MFGFFKKQSKTKDNSAEVIQQSHGEVTMTVHSIDDEDLVDLRRRLESRVKELSSQIAIKDAEANQLKDVLGETKRQLDFKTAGMDQVQSELQAAYIETERARQSLYRLKEELVNYRHENEDLKEKLNKKDESSDEEDESSDEEDSSTESRPSRSSLESRVKELEEEIQALKAERDELLEARNKLEAERQEEIKIIQEALEEALADQEAARSCFEKDYEQLRTVNSDREQQMLDDFEWKLRQVEQAAKKKMEDKAKEAEKKVLEARIDVERKVAAHNRDLEKLKTAEAELSTLRNMSHDQQRLLREAQRGIESEQVNQRILKEEIARLNSQVEREKNILAAVQTLNQKKLEEREQIFECRLERQRKEVTIEVEERVKGELQVQHRDAMQEALRLCREQHEIEKTDANKQAQNRIDALQRQISALRDLISKKELEFQKQLNIAQDCADSGSLELRRKLDKLDMSYQDKLDALQEKHASELEEAERRVAQAEMQAGSSRTTLELVKEQMARDAEEKIRNMHQMHHQQLARQQREMQETHEEELLIIQQKHEAELAALCKGRINGDIELESTKFSDTVSKLRKQELMISDLTSTIREQDHALTTLTQEKRALQLQLSRIGSSRDNNNSSPVKGLERISECTEPSRSSRESSVSRSDNVFSSCSSENYIETLDSQTQLYDRHTDSQTQLYDRHTDSQTQLYDRHTDSQSQLYDRHTDSQTQLYDRHTDSPIEHTDSQIEQLACQIRQPDSPIEQLECQIRHPDSPNYSQIELECNIRHPDSPCQIGQDRNSSSQIKIIESSEIEQVEGARSSNTQIQLHFSQLGPYDSFEEQIEPLIEEPDSPELEEDINMSECDRNSDNFEDFEDPMVVTNNNLSVQFDCERSTYLSISPARSDTTNCMSMASSPSPERSITFSKNSSNPEVSEECSSNELQIPRTYFLSHSPDSIFPREKCFLSRSKSLGTKLQKMHLFSRASSSPL